MAVQVPVSLKEILEGMEFQSDEITAYLHRPTGRVIPISAELATRALRCPAWFWVDWD